MNAVNTKHRTLHLRLKYRFQSRRVLILLTACAIFKERLCCPPRSRCLVLANEMRMNQTDGGWWGYIRTPNIHNMCHQKILDSPFAGRHKHRDF